MLSFDSDDAAGVIELTVDGRIESGDYDAALAAIEHQLRRHDKVDVVEVIRDFDGMTPSLWWRDLAWSYSHLDQFGRCAVVTDQSWIGPVVRIVGALMPAEVRAFPLAEIDAARHWARHESGTDADAGPARATAG